MSDKGASWITRMNKNAKYEIITQKIYDYIEYADGGIINDSMIELNSKADSAKARLIVYKDPESGKVLSFMTNILTIMHSQ